MAQCVQSVQEFIQDSFVPLVAALCSEEAERLTRKNSLSFAELVKPFCRLTSEGRCRERSGAGGLFTRGGDGGVPRPLPVRPAGEGSRPAGAAAAAPPLPCCPARLSRAGAGGETPSPGPRPPGRAFPGAARGSAEARVCRGRPRWLLSLISFALFFSVEPWKLGFSRRHHRASGRLKGEVPLDLALPNGFFPFFKTTYLANTCT